MLGLNIHVKNGRPLVMNWLDVALMVVHRLNMNDGVCTNIMHRF